MTSSSCTYSCFSSSFLKNIHVDFFGIQFVVNLTQNILFLLEKLKTYTSHRASFVTRNEATKAYIYKPLVSIFVHIYKRFCHSLLFCLLRSYYIAKVHWQQIERYTQQQKFLLSFTWGKHQALTAFSEFADSAPANGLTRLAS